MSDVETESLTEIALFPIPGSVCLPFTKVPLHVFEPRYRKLVKESVQLKRRIAVCHTKKTVHAAKPNQTQAEVLNSNQSTYEPYPVFSAGFAEILEVTADGRLAVEITMDQRFEFVRDVQVLPYRMAACRAYVDDAAAEDPRITRQLREQVQIDLIRITAKESVEVSLALRSPQWTGLPDSAYSFKVFEIIRFDPDLMQMLLEIRTPQQRLRFLAQALATSRR